ncbi:hypothetical protein K1719_000480 [Acacia pycnantha]|nr:hypothetical protein K1719_000480 [Acacia pycnantha]
MRTIDHDDETLAAESLGCLSDGGRKSPKEASPGRLLNLLSSFPSKDGTVFTAFKNRKLLWKEAMLLHANSEDEDSDFPSANLLARNGIKISFVNLMHFQQGARWLLMKSRACLGVYPHFHSKSL